MLARFPDVVLLIPRRTQKRLHGLPDVVCLRGPRRGCMDSQTNPDAVAWTPRRPKNMRVCLDANSWPFCWPFCVGHETFRVGHETFRVGQETGLSPTPGLFAGLFAWGTRHFAWGTRRASAPKFSGQEQCNFGLRGSGLQVSSHVSSFLLASILQASILQASILQASILQASIHRAHVSSFLHASVCADRVCLWAASVLQVSSKCEGGYVLPTLE